MIFQKSQKKFFCQYLKSWSSSTPPKSMATNTPSSLHSQSCRQRVFCRLIGLYMLMMYAIIIVFTSSYSCHIQLHFSLRPDLGQGWWQRTERKSVHRNLFKKLPTLPPRVEKRLLKYFCLGKKEWFWGTFLHLSRFLFSGLGGVSQ